MLFLYIPGTKAELTVLFLGSVCLLPKKYQATLPSLFSALSGFNTALHGPVLPPLSAQSVFKLFSA